MLETKVAVKQVGRSCPQLAVDSETDIEIGKPEPRGLGVRLSVKDEVWVES